MAAEQFISKYTSAEIEALLDKINSLDLSNSLDSYYDKNKVNQLLTNQNNSDIFKHIFKAPLHDVSETIPDNDLVSNYNVSIKSFTVSSVANNNLYTISVAFSGTNLKNHTNGAGTQGYWMGIAVPEEILLDGYTVHFARGFGSPVDLNSLSYDSITPAYFDPDVNVASEGKWCTFYREVGEAKQNNNHAFVVFRYTKSGSDTFYYIYDYDYTNVTLSQ